jgi:hypothetical protein
LRCGPFWPPPTSERHAVAREHVGDPALPDRHQIGFVNPIGERPEYVDATAQDLGLEARLAVQRDEARRDRALRRPHLLDDADLVVGNVAKDVGDTDQDEQQDDDDCPAADRDGVVEDRVHDRSLARARPYSRSNGSILLPDVAPAAGPTRAALSSSAARFRKHSEQRAGA